MPAPLPPEKIFPLMRFIAEKAKNVKSPMNLHKLCRQFKEETGTLMSMNGLRERVHKYRLKIHEMNEFDMETKVKMIFALSAPIDARFLTEMKKVADVEVDDQQKIIHYKQKDGGLELRGKYLGLSMNERDREIIHLLAEKSKTTDKPVVVKSLLREFKANTGCTDSIVALEHRYQRVKNAIYYSSEIDKNTKIKMMFISNVKIPDEVLKELQKDADVEVDEEGRITKYKSKDGSLELEGSHGLSTSMKSVYSDRWQTIYQKANENKSEGDDDEDTNGQKTIEKKRIDLVRFLINRTKSATSPLSFYKLAKDYKIEFKSTEPLKRNESRIRSFRQRFPETNQFDKPTKVRMLFALSVPIDAKLLKELQNDAIVELDANQRIKKYEAKDGSLELEGDHSAWRARRRSGKTRNTKTSVVNGSSESEEEGENEENSSETDGSEGEDASTSSSARRSDRLRKYRISLQNKNKKRQLLEKNSDSTHTRNHARLSRGKKRARISSSSSETSEDLEESLTLEHDPLMDSETTNNVANSGDDFDYDPPANNHYEENLERRVTDPISGRDIETPDVRDDMEEEEKKEEESSASSFAKIESMSLLELLNHLRPPIVQYTPTLVSKIDENIEKLKEKDKQIPFHLIIESLESCIQILSIPDQIYFDENKTSLSDFFYRLGMAMRSILHLNIDNLAWAKDTKVSMKHIRFAMEDTLDKILN